MTTEQTGEYVTITPSPEMRTAVLAAAGLPDLTVRPPVRSWVVTWENTAGSPCGNQVNAPDRDSAIWRVALLMQTPRPGLIKFVSCEPEHEAGA